MRELLGQVILSWATNRANRGRNSFRMVLLRLRALLECERSDALEMEPPIAWDDLDDQ
jgi:hypothetical protein